MFLCLLKRRTNPKLRPLLNFFLETAFGVVYLCFCIHPCLSTVPPYWVFWVFWVSWVFWVFWVSVISNFLPFWRTLVSLGVQLNPFFFFFSFSSTNHVLSLYTKNNHVLNLKPKGIGKHHRAIGFRKTCQTSAGEDPSESASKRSYKAL